MGEVVKHIVALFVAMALGSLAATAGERKLEIAATEFPPYYGKDLDGKGFFSEIVREAFRRSGHEAEIKFLPWKRAFEGAKQGKYDALYSVWHRPEREEWFVFSDPLPANELGFFQHKDSKISFSDYDALKPYTIGVVRGYASPPGFDDAGLKTSLAVDDEQNLRKLHKQRVDLVLVDRIVATHIIQSQIPEALAVLEWLDPPAHVDIQYLVASLQVSDHAEIVARFNAGLAEMTADGTLQTIMAKNGF